MTTITIERVAEFIKNPLDNGLTRGEQMELARIAQAVITTEPEYWLSVHKFQSYLKFSRADAELDVAENGGICVVPLYTAPPAPVVPDRTMFETWWESQNGSPFDSWDSIRTTDGYCDDGIDGQFEAWNACRAAMLSQEKTMDNRYEIAEQNGMSREFADWFFDNKKAGCGNVWFVMMAAMWEGWKGRAAMLKGNHRDLSQPVDPQVAEYESIMLHGSQPVSDELPEIECDICGFKSTDSDGAHYCCEDNSND